MSKTHDDHGVSKAGPDVVRLLIGWTRKLNGLTSGKHGHPRLTVFARIAVLWFGLWLAGPILWHALMTMPIGLVAIVGLGLTIRVGLWYWRRYR